MTKKEKLIEYYRTFCKPFNEQNAELFKQETYKPAGEEEWVNTMLNKYSSGKDKEYIYVLYQRVLHYKRVNG